MQGWAFPSSGSTATGDLETYEGFRASLVKELGRDYDAILACYRELRPSAYALLVSKVSTPKQRRWLVNMLIFMMEPMTRLTKIIDGAVLKAAVAQDVLGAIRVVFVRQILLSAEVRGDGWSGFIRDLCGAQQLRGVMNLISCDPAFRFTVVGVIVRTERAWLKLVTAPPGSVDAVDVLAGPVSLVTAPPGSVDAVDVLAGPVHDFVRAAELRASGGSGTLSFTGGADDCMLFAYLAYFATRVGGKPADLARLHLRLLSSSSFIALDAFFANTPASRSRALSSCDELLRTKNETLRLLTWCMRPLRDIAVNKKSFADLREIVALRDVSFAETVQNALYGVPALAIFLAVVSGLPLPNYLRADTHNALVGQLLAEDQQLIHRIRQKQFLVGTGVGIDASRFDGSRGQLSEARMGKLARAEKLPWDQTEFLSVFDRNADGATLTAIKDCEVCPREVLNLASAKLGRVSRAASMTLAPLANASEFVYSLLLVTYKVRALRGLGQLRDSNAAAAAAAVALIADMDYYAVPTWCKLFNQLWAYVLSCHAAESFVAALQNASLEERLAPLEIATPPGCEAAVNECLPQTLHEYFCDPNLLDDLVELSELVLRGDGLHTKDAWAALTAALPSGQDVYAYIVPFQGASRASVYDVDFTPSGYVSTQELFGSSKDDWEFTWNKLSWLVNDAARRSSRADPSLVAGDSVPTGAPAHASQSDSDRRAKYAEMQTTWCRRWGQSAAVIMLPRASEFRTVGNAVVLTTVHGADFSMVVQPLVFLLGHLHEHGRTGEASTMLTHFLGGFQERCAAYTPSAPARLPASEVKSRVVSASEAKSRVLLVLHHLLLSLAPMFIGVSDGGRVMAATLRKNITTACSSEGLPICSAAVVAHMRAFADLGATRTDLVNIIAIPAALTCVQLAPTFATDAFTEKQLTAIPPSIRADDYFMKPADAETFHSSAASSMYYYRCEPPPLTLRLVMQWLKAGSSMRQQQQQQQQQHGASGTSHVAPRRAEIFNPMERRGAASGERVQGGQSLGGGISVGRLCETAVFDCRELVSVTLRAGIAVCAVRPGRDITLYEQSNGILKFSVADLESSGRMAGGSDAAAGTQYQVQSTFQSHERAWDFVQGYSAARTIVLTTSLMLFKVSPTQWRPYLNTAGVAKIPDACLLFLDVVDAHEEFGLSLPREVLDLLLLCARAVTGNADRATEDADAVRPYVRSTRQEMLCSADPRALLDKCTGVAHFMCGLIDAVAKANSLLTAAVYGFLASVKASRDAERALGLAVVGPLLAARGWGLVAAVAETSAANLFKALLCLGTGVDADNKEEYVPGPVKSMALALDFMQGCAGVVSSVCEFLSPKCARILEPARDVRRHRYELRAARSRGPAGVPADTDGAKEAKGGGGGGGRGTLAVDAAAAPPPIGGGGGGGGGRGRGGRDAEPVRPAPPPVVGLGAAAAQPVGGGESSGRGRVPKVAAHPPGVVPGSKDAAAAAASPRHRRVSLEGKAPAYRLSDELLLFMHDPPADAMRMSSEQARYCSGYVVGSILGPACNRLVFVSPTAQDNYYDPIDGLVLCYIAHESVLQGAVAPAAASADAGAGAGAGGDIELALQWLLDVARSPMSWTMKQRVLQICYQRGEGDVVTSYAFQSSAVPPCIDDVVVLSSLLKRCPLRGGAHGGFSVKEALSTLQLAPTIDSFDSTREAAGPRCPTWGVLKTLPHQVDVTNRVGGDLYGLNMVPMNSRLLSSLRLHGVKVEVVDFKDTSLGSDAQADSVRLMHIVSAFRKSRCCFVHVTGLPAPSNVLMKWCAEYTARNFWSWISFQGSSAAWLWPEILDRVVNRDAEGGAADDRLDTIRVRFEGGTVQFDRSCKAAKTSYEEQWEGSLAKALEDPTKSRVLVVGSPGIGKTYHLDEMRRKNKRGMKPLRLDGSDDRFTRTALVDVLDQEVDPKGLTLLIMDEFHMLHIELKRQLLEWHATRMNVRLVMLANRFSDEDKSLFESSSDTETVMVHACGNVKKSLEQAAIVMHAKRGGLADSSFEAWLGERSQVGDGEARQLHFCYIWLKAASGVFGPDMLSRRLLDVSSPIFDVMSLGDNSSTPNAVLLRDEMQKWRRTINRDNTFSKEVVDAVLAVYTKTVREAVDAARESRELPRREVHEKVMLASRRSVAEFCRNERNAGSHAVRIIVGAALVEEGDAALSFPEFVLPPVHSTQRPPLSKNPFQLHPFARLACWVVYRKRRAASLLAGDGTRAAERGSAPGADDADRQVMFPVVGAERGAASRDVEEEDPAVIEAAQLATRFVGIMSVTDLAARFPVIKYGRASTLDACDVLRASECRLADIAQVTDALQHGFGVDWEGVRAAWAAQPIADVKGFLKLLSVWPATLNQMLKPSEKQPAAEHKVLVDSLRFLLRVDLSTSLASLCVHVPLDGTAFEQCRDAQCVPYMASWSLYHKAPVGAVDRAVHDGNVRDVAYMLVWASRFGRADMAAEPSTIAERTELLVKHLVLATEYFTSQICDAAAGGAREASENASQMLADLWNGVFAGMMPPPVVKGRQLSAVAYVTICERTVSLARACAPPCRVQCVLPRRPCVRML